MQKVNHFTLTYQVKMHHEDAGAFPDIVVQANLLLRQKKKGIPECDHRENYYV